MKAHRIAVIGAGPSALFLVAALLERATEPIGIAICWETRPTVGAEVSTFAAGERSGMARDGAPFATAFGVAVGSFAQRRSPR